ncbi:MAG: FGGY family carbohydrate kinase, partial [Spirochaetota bacterium]
MSILGIDIGTTNCKGTVFSIGGSSSDEPILCRAEREYPLIHLRPDWAELDSRAVIEAVKDVIRELALKSRTDPIRALSVCSMGEAMTPVSEDRRILGNAIIHLDSRGREQIDGFFGRIGKDEFFSINPNIPGTNYSLPKLLWRKDRERALFDSAWKFLLFDELLLFMLGLEPLTSFSLANRTMLFDIRAERLSDRLLSLSGMDSGMLGRPVASGTLAGELGAKVAADLGLERGVVCVVGAHDQCCNALGAGVTRAGQAVCGIGTVECITP